MAKLPPELANELEFYKTTENPQLFSLEIKSNYVHSFGGIGGLGLILLFVFFGAAIFSITRSWEMALICFAAAFMMHLNFFSHKIKIADGFLTYEKYFLFKTRIPLTEIKKAKRESIRKRSADLYLYPEKTAEWEKFGIDTKSFQWKDNRRLNAILENLTGKKV